MSLRAEDDHEHVHPAERMTGLDHAILAILIAIGVVLWAVIGSLSATLFHLSPLGSIVVMVLWPIPLMFLVFIATEIVRPFWRLIRHNAERIEGYHD